MKDVSLVISWMAIAAVITAAMTFIVMHIALRLNIVDHPNERSCHIKPTPRGGGLAIVITSLISAITLLMSDYQAPQGGPHLLVATTIVVGVSLCDDVSSLSARLRLLLHLSAAFTALLGVGPAETLNIGPLGRINLGVAAWPLTIFWIVGMTNAFNFMDGVDGIAGSTSAVAFCMVSISLLSAGESFSGLIAAAIGGASFGFLLWNWQPAKIFMGDVGSTFLGFSISVLPLSCADELKTWLVPLVTLLMGPFILDTSFTLLRRIANGETITAAHRNHYYQRLVTSGWQPATVATIYAAASLAGGVAANLFFTSP